MFTTAEIDGEELRLILSAFNSALGTFSGGNTLSKGKLVQGGGSAESLTSRISQAEMKGMSGRRTCTSLQYASCSAGPLKVPCKPSEPFHRLD
jgi:hypothetical protein